MTAIMQHDQGRPDDRPLKVHGAFPQPAKRGPLAVLVSAFLHVLLIWVLINITKAVVKPETSELVAFLLPKSKPGGGGGGGVGGPVAKSTPPPPPPVETKPVVVPPPAVVPIVVPDVIPPVTAAVPTPAAPTQTVSSGVGSSGTGGGKGGGIGTGDGPGTGSGIGPGTGSGKGGGDGNANKPPEGKQLILPCIDCDTPKEFRGKPITISLFVLVSGKVDSVKTEPVITNKKFAQMVKETMMGYGFRPGTDSTGKKISMWYVVTLTF